MYRLVVIHHPPGSFWKSPRNPGNQTQTAKYLRNDQIIHHAINLNIKLTNITPLT